MKPKLIGDPKHFKIDPNQLQELDKIIASVLTNYKLSEGLKFARWAEIDGLISDIPEIYFACVESFPKEYRPDFVFSGTVFGKEKTIYMWLPFFN